jgi:hypothetical protein
MNQKELIQYLKDDVFDCCHPQAFEYITNLIKAVEDHRAQKADDRCIEDDDRLYETLGDGIRCDRRVGSKEEMLKNCARFINRRCQQGHWPTYAQLEEQIADLKHLVWQFVPQADNHLDALERKYNANRPSS